MNQIDKGHRFGFLSFGTQTLKRKIVLIYIPLVLLPLMVSGYVSNYFTKQAIINKTVSNVAKESKLISMRINMLILNTQNCANLLSRDLNGVTQGEAPKEPHIVDVAKRKNVLNILDYSLLVFPDLESITFLDMAGNLYSTETSIERSDVLSVEPDFLAFVEKSNGNNLWRPMEIRRYLSTDSKGPVLTLCKKILDINTQEKLGYLFININERTLSDVFRGMELSKAEDYYIVDQEDKIISCADKARLLQPLSNPAFPESLHSSGNNSEILKINRRNWFIAQTQIEIPKWKLVYEIPVKELTGDTQKVTSILFLIGFVCIVFALAGANLLSGLITRPIGQLADKMKYVTEGNLDAYCDIQSGGEIGMLARCFNEMISKIRGLLGEIASEQKKKRHYEFALIQSQIKPHFLYNTLDLVYVLCKMGRPVQAANATKVLADFFKSVLNHGDEIISIREEMKIVENYLTIQKIRYEDILDFSIEVEAEALEHRIPKLTLQPLVENAIYHGLRPGCCKGLLTVSVYLFQGDLVLKVYDTGIGMSTEKLSKIQADIRDGRSLQKSFGLANVNDRLKLYFSGAYDMQITSTPGEGTQALIRISGDIKDEVAYV